MPQCRECNKIFKKTSIGMRGGKVRNNEKLCSECWFKVKRGGGRVRK